MHKLTVDPDQTVTECDIYSKYSDWQARANSVVLTRRRGKTASYWTYAVCIKYRIFTPSIWTGKYELRV